MVGKMAFLAYKLGDAKVHAQLEGRGRSGRWRRGLAVALAVGLVSVLVGAAPAWGAFGFITKWGTPGSGVSQFNQSAGVAIDSAGNVYVADRSNHRVHKFSSTGVFERMWGWGVQNGASAFQICTSSCQAGLPGTGDGQFNNPRGLVIDSAGNVYVGDQENNRVQKFTSTGTFSLKWGKNGGDGTTGTGNGEFKQPVGLAINSADNVYVADTFNHRVQKFSSTGTFSLKWGKNGGDGTTGSGNGEFNLPFGVALDSAGNVYVADSFNHRVQKFSSAGTFTLKWGRNGGDGTAGSGDGEFDTPSAVALDSAGNVYVADTLNHRVQKFGELSSTSPLPPPPGSTPPPPPPPKPPKPPRPECTNPTTLLVTCADLAGPPGVCAAGAELLPQCLEPVVPRTTCNGAGVCYQTTPGERPAAGSCASLGQAPPECNVPTREVPVACVRHGFAVNLPLVPGQVCWAGAPRPINNCPPPSTLVVPTCSFSTTVTGPSTPSGAAAAARRQTVRGSQLTVTIGCPKVLADPATKRCDGTVAVDGLRTSLLRTLASQALYSAGAYRYFIPGAAAYAGPFQRAANAIAKRTLGGRKLPKPVSTTAVVAALGRNDEHTASWAASLQRAVDEYRRLAGRVRRYRDPSRAAARPTRSTTTFTRFSLKSSSRGARIRVPLSAAAVRRLLGEAPIAGRVPIRVILSFRTKLRPVVRFADLVVRLS
jgi:sugar lactone lactonase YvrE